MSPSGESGVPQIIRFAYAPRLGFKFAATTTGRFKCVLPDLDVFEVDLPTIKFAIGPVPSSARLTPAHAI